MSDMMSNNEPAAQLDNGDHGVKNVFFLSPEVEKNCTQNFGFKCPAKDEAT